MKVAQLIEGKTYRNKKGVRRYIYQIVGPDSDFTPNHVYYVQEDEHVVHHIPSQEFAAWALREAAHFPRHRN
jgi:hypothetical protein